jgi:O-antigen chain-terminating methyltransferase
MSTDPNKSALSWEELRQEITSPPWWSKLFPGAARQQRITQALMETVESLSRQILGREPNFEQEATNPAMAESLAHLDEVCIGFNQTLHNHQTWLVQVEKSLEALPHLEHRLNELHRLKQSLAEVAAQVSALISSFSAFDSRILQSDNRLQEHKSEQQKLHHAINEQADEFQVEQRKLQQTIEEQANTQQAEQNESREKLAQLVTQISHDEAKLTELIAGYDQLKDHSGQFEVSLSSINASLTRTRRSLKNWVDQLNLPTAKQRRRFDEFYLAFENEFRGTTEQIREKQSCYLPVVEAIKERSSVRRWIDLGCGRGEWLQELTSLGMTPEGIDNSPTMIASCLEKGLTAIEVDAISHLSAQGDESAAGISAFHLVEHISPNDFLSLVEEAHRVLAPGGCLIFETPNPQNISVGSCNFYMDPTHRNPVTPMTAEFMARNTGFSHVETLRLFPMAKLDEKDELATSPVEREYFDYFYGPQDFAIIATK